MVICSKNLKKASAGCKIVYSLSYEIKQNYHGTLRRSCLHSSAITM